MAERVRTARPPQLKRTGNPVAPEKPRDLPAESAEAAAPTGPRIRWDDANMKSAYANVCNVAGTREEIVLLFGMNQAWYSGQKEVTIQLADRVVMSPFVAKRLATLLNNVIKDYESKYGTLEI
jgi:hypothetical protein